jgi:hypothetical protein
MLSMNGRATPTFTQLAQMSEIVLMGYLQEEARELFQPQSL